MSASFLPAFSENQYANNVVSDISMTRDEAKMIVGMEFDLSQIKLKSTQATVFIPLIVNGNDTLSLPEVGVYGRTRWYKFDRADKLPADYNPSIALRYKKNMGTYPYLVDVEYQDWMNGSEIVMKYVDYGCANCQTTYINPGILAQYEEKITNLFFPQFIYKEAVAEVVKTRELSGKAYVDFPVNQTVIKPDYRNNAFELAKIIATIDSVKNDKDITVTSLSIKGFASPEGSYDNNARLAKGRTEALKDYVENLYKFPTSFISTSYEPEDWQGLKEWVEKSDIENKEGILSIIDLDLAPDPKNTKIQTTYPKQYKYLLANVYPGLRHSDYRIEYSIKQFTDMNEIAEVFKTSPQKLSLSEMYTLASNYEPGSEEYNEIFETAVRMYPDDETANLNAANAAMNVGNLKAAEKYLQKAGNSAETIYAKGILAALQGDREKAETLIQSSIFKGLNQAEQILENLKNSKLPTEK